MAMLPQKWSISGLSVELGLDRRTIAKRLAGLKPAAVENEINYYSLREALQRLGLSVDHKFDEEDFKVIAVDFLPALYDELAPRLAVIIKKKTGLSSEKVWQIFEEGYPSIREIVRKTLEEDSDEFDMGPIELLINLADPKRRRKYCKWLDREATKATSEKDFEGPSFLDEKLRAGRKNG